MKPASLLFISFLVTLFLFNAEQVCSQDIHLGNHRADGPAFTATAASNQKPTQLQRLGTCVICPSGSIAEQEPCGQDINGGCNMTSLNYENLLLGQYVCGSMWSDSIMRDTDWFTFSVDKKVTFNMTAVTRMPSQAVLLDPYCAYIIYDYDSVHNDCDTLQLSAALDSGSYVLVFTPLFFVPNPCDTTTDENLYYFLADTAKYIEPNDLCFNAITIVCGDTVVSNTNNATVSTNPSGFCGTTPAAPGLWYRLVGTGDSVRVSTCNALTNYDTKINVYQGSCSNLTCVGGDDDDFLCSYSSLRSTFSFLADNGVVYYILVNGYGGETGQFELTVECIEPPMPPVNDLCINALPIQCGQSLAGTTNSTTVDTVPSCGPSVTAPGVWYHYIGDGSDITVSTCNAANYDTKITVYSGACGALTCIGGNDDGAGCSGFTSEFTFPSTAGTDYWILVHGFQSQTGNFTLSLTCDTPCTPVPVNDDCSDAIMLTVNPAGACSPDTGTNACATAATQQPSCDPFGNVLDVWYKFNTGPDSSVQLTLSAITATELKYALYDSCNGQLLTCQNLTSGTDTLVNLNPGTTYYLQIWNNGSGEEGSFQICLERTVQVLCPPVDSLWVTRIKPTSARLNWKPVSGATAYLIRGWALGSTIIKYIPIPPGSPNYKDVFGLVYNRTYVWQILAICDTVPATWSQLDTFTTICQQPDSNWAFPVTATGARLNWHPVGGAVGYEIRGRKLGGPWVNLLTGPVPFKDVFGLTPSSTYIWKVRTWCDPNGFATSTYTPNDTFTTASGSRLAARDPFQQELPVRLVPNPASEECFVILNENGFQQPVNLEIRDVSGRILYETLVINQKQRIPLDALPQGIYQVVLTSDEFRSIERLIITR